MQETDSFRIKNILKEIPFFEEFNDDDLDYFSHQVSLQSIKPGTVLFQKGDVGDYLFFIVEGSINIILDSPYYKTLSATLGPGNSVGEMSLIDSFQRSAAIHVAESSEILILTKNRFETINEENPSVGMKILKGLAKNLSKRLRGLSGRFADLA